MREEDRPLLLFDSGVGGLSVLRAVTALLPSAPIVYVADNGGFPYGTKTEAELTARVPALLGRLVERYHPRLVVIPCNTASVIALGPIRAALNLPVVGTVPAIKPAALVSKTRAIGVLGTDATVRQPYVDRLSAEFAADCTVVRQGSAALVQLAEDKLRGLLVDSNVIAGELGKLLNQPGGDQIDTVVLACTHFPLLRDELAAVSPRPIAFIDSAEGIARRVAFLTQNQPWPAQRPQGIAVFTAPFDVPPALASALKSYGLTRIEAL
ncbi:MAG: glutamate racemase [Sphingomonadaceae bacterium]